MSRLRSVRIRCVFIVLIALLSALLTFKCICRSVHSGGEGPFENMYEKASRTILEVVSSSCSEKKSRHYISQVVGALGSPNSLQLVYG